MEMAFLVPTIWTQHSSVPTPAHSIHQWTHGFCWHPISTDCPASNMGSIMLCCHNLIVFTDLCTKFWPCVTIPTNISKNYWKKQTNKQQLQNQLTGFMLISNIYSIFYGIETPQRLCSFFNLLYQQFPLEQNLSYHLQNSRKSNYI